MTAPSQRSTIGALTAVSLGVSLIVGCIIVAARVLSLVGLRSLGACGVGGAVLFAIICLASVGRDVVRLRIARPTRAEAALVLLALAAGWLIASRTFDLSFFAPTTFTVDAAHHAGLVTWMVDRGHVPHGFQPELTSFSDYPLWGHVVPAIASSITGLEPITTLWLMALASVVLQWPLTAVIARAVTRGRSWAVAAVPMLLMILAWRFTIGLATWDFFFAQLVSLFMAVAGVAFIASAEAAAAPIRRWIPASAVFSAAALFTYPQQAIIVPLSAAAALLTRKYARRPSIVAVAGVSVAAIVVVALAVVLLRSQNYLTPQALLGAGEGSVTQPAMRTLGGWLPTALAIVGAFVLVARARSRDGAAGAAIGAAAGPTLLGLGLWAAKSGFLVHLDVTSYRITKNVYSAVPLVAVLAAVAVGWAFERRATRTPVRPTLALVVTVVAVLAVSSRPKPLSGVAVPLVSRDATTLGTWAREHLDVLRVGVVGPGLEPYTLWFSALLRPVPTDPAGLDASTAVATYLRGDAPANTPLTLASTRWSAWPLGPSTEKYLLVSGLPFVNQYLARPGVRVLRRRGDAAILVRKERSDQGAVAATTGGASGADSGHAEQGTAGLP